MELTTRQAEVLRTVVETHVEMGQPVGSKWLAEHADLPWKPSTIRAELAKLEELGLLQHPHTSAGRVPTHTRHRYYVGELLEKGTLPVPRPNFHLTDMRREVEGKLRAPPEPLSQVPNLLAIVSAPPIATTTIRHIEVLLLQPQVAMVVVITSTGGVTKRVISYAHPVDPGLVDWSADYLNDALGGMALGGRMIHSKLANPGLTRGERDFLATLAPVFSGLEETAEDTLFVEGAARLLSEDRVQELSQIDDLLQLLERRMALLGLLREALTEPSVYLRIGRENVSPAFHSLSIVAANYGLANRNLGAVSVVGPVRMDYGVAIGSVRQAAAELSRFVEQLYGE